MEKFTQGFFKMCFCVLETRVTRMGGCVEGVRTLYALVI